MLTQRERDDRLCRDVVAILARLAEALAPEAVERCLGCGAWVAPDAACPTCTALAAARRDVDSWWHA